MDEKQRTETDDNSLFGLQPETIHALIEVMEFARKKYGLAVARDLWAASRLPLPSGEWDSISELEAADHAEINSLEDLQNALWPK